MRPRVTIASTITVMATQRLATSGSALCGSTGWSNAECPSARMFSPRAGNMAMR